MGELRHDRDCCRKYDQSDSKEFFHVIPVLLRLQRYAYSNVLLILDTNLAWLCSNNHKVDMKKHYIFLKSFTEPTLHKY
jgi:hypothetical protein